MIRPVSYRHYVLSVLAVIMLFNYVDRLALGIVLEDIKADLHLSDTELGLLSGMAFALFYSVMGIPIARWADRGDRVAIISLTSILWSAAVALCGQAQSFAQLLLIRVGVGVGEAGCNPPALSLIADYFTRSERPRATAIYAMGGAFSFVFGYFGAGWLNQLYGWRVTFLLLGLPGLLLALLAWITIKEPRKVKPPQCGFWVRVPAVIDTPATGPSLQDVCSRLWANITFRYLLLYQSVEYFFGYGISQWQPTFFTRSFGLTSGEIGTLMAMTWGIGGLAGAYLGGEWAARYAANNERLQLKAIAVAISLSTVVGVLIYLSANPYAAFAMVAVFILLQYMVNGPLLATIQALVPGNMRAVSFAFIYFVANLLGLGLGPLAVGALSDLLHPWAGNESLRYALLFLAPGYFFCAWLAWQASRTVARDVGAVHDDSAEQDKAGATLVEARIAQGS